MGLKKAVYQGKKYTNYGNNDNEVSGSVSKHRKKEKKKPFIHGQKQYLGVSFNPIFFFFSFSSTEGGVAGVVLDYFPLYAIFLFVFC